MDEPALRIATLEDEVTLDALMKTSAEALFPRFYDERQSASAVRYVAQIDRMLLEDGTYFVLESGEEAVGCGGWSRRDKLYTGSGDSEDDARLLDPATEPARVRAMFVRADWTRRGLGRLGPPNLGAEWHAADQDDQGHARGSQQSRQQGRLQ